jgi:hypothetical protein
MAPETADEATLEAAQQAAPRAAMSDAGRAGALATVGATSPGGIGSRMTTAVLQVVGSIPRSLEPASTAPALRARGLAKVAARKAAGISGGAALVPGPLGVLSLLPDLVGVWRVQSQMVADIAASYGRSATLTTEQMLYCLFRHLFSHGLRDVVVRSGERFLVRQVSRPVLQRLAQTIGVRLSQHTAAKAVARYAPLVGAIGVGAYAYMDTQQVARTAIELFEADMVLEPPAPMPAPQETLD